MNLFTRSFLGRKAVMQTSRHTVLSLVTLLVFWLGALGRADAETVLNDFQDRVIFATIPICWNSYVPNALDASTDHLAMSEPLSARSEERSPVRNLKFAGYPQQYFMIPVLFDASVSGNWLVFSLQEAAQREDLNGDGDFNDRVVHVHDLERGETRNLQLVDYLAPTSFWLFANWLICTVKESEQDEDLNGDGDRVDHVIHVHDLQRGETKNLGLAAWLTQYSMNWLVFVVKESDQGEDLNGDNDTKDTVIQVHDLRTGLTTNLKLAAQFLGLSDDCLLVKAKEWEQGADFNGDGDTKDRVLHRYDLATGKTKNLRISVFGGVLSKRWFVFRASESDEKDLNGSGHIAGRVLHVYELETGKITNLRLAGFGNERMVGDRVVFRVYEQDQGTDLNGDGDKEDHVIHVHDLVTGKTTNTKLAGFLGKSRENWLVFMVHEDEQGEDFNSDGDRKDKVLHVHNMETGDMRNLGISIGRCGKPIEGLPRVVRSRWIMFQALEAAQEKDLNGDGDTEDAVLQVYDLESRETRTLGKADKEEGVLMKMPPHMERWLVLGLLESSRGIDLNGDGDTEDKVLHLYDFETGETKNIRLALGYPVLSGNWLALWTPESDQGEDLNGDGDTEDKVLHLYDFETGKTTNIRLALSHLDMSGNWLALWVPESDQGEDLNDDGDREDHILHSVDLSKLRSAQRRRGDTKQQPPAETGRSK